MSDKFNKIYEQSLKNPELFWKKASDDIFCFKIDDFNLTGYDPHPLIKGKVAI